MKKLEICLSPDLIEASKPDGKTVVIVDIFRATSCMVTGFAHGVDRILPVASLDECRIYQHAGYITAAERDGEKADGFDLGNSPFSFMEPWLHGKSLAMTTTNGTRALSLSRAADEIVIGSFLNIGTLCDFLALQSNDILVVCAGWKGRPNAEDTLFAGALAHELKNEVFLDQDATLIAVDLYEAHRRNLRSYLSKFSHIQRLIRLGAEKDIDFCLNFNLYHVLPILRGEALVNRLV